MSFGIGSNETGWKTSWLAMAEATAVFAAGDGIPVPEGERPTGVKGPLEPSAFEPQIGSVGLTLEVALTA